MEKKIIKILILLNNQILVSQIEEVGSELGEPDCKLIEPFVIQSDMTLIPWMLDYTPQNVFMIHSDKILTIIDPNNSILKKYEDLIK
jgi:hypothetical protein